MPACGICGRVPELCTYYTATHCNTLQHAATHCNALQHTHCTTRCIGCQNCAHVPLQHTATRCNTLQQAATRCNTLQHTAARCNTLIARCVGCQNCAYVTPKSNRKKNMSGFCTCWIAWGPLPWRLLGAYLQQICRVSESYTLLENKTSAKNTQKSAHIVRAWGPRWRLLLGAYRQQICRVSESCIYCTKKLGDCCMCNIGKVGVWIGA